MKTCILSITLFIILPLSSIAQCWKTVSTGTLYGAAIAEDSTLWAWGVNSCGEFDSVGLTNINIPTCISNSHDWIKVDVSWGGCAIKADGSLWCWGDNGAGQWGGGPGQLRLRQMGEDHDWLDVSVQEHALALKKNHTLWAWGKNTNGQIGNSSVVNQPTLLQISSEVGWQKISAGSEHSLGIKIDGTLWAWGDNIAGELGDNTYTDRLQPVQIGQSTDWKEISAGRQHSLAMKNDGSLWAWGANGAGVLGLGDTTVHTKNTPQHVGTETNWLMISAGSSYSMALKQDSTLWVWGSGIVGVLGDGVSVNVLGHCRISPYKISGYTWRTIAAGDWLSAGIAKTKNMLGWGSAGTTGDGTIQYRTIPTPVVADTCIVPPVITDLNDMNVLRQTARIFPNPATDVLQISFTLNAISPVTISIRDATGRAVIAHSETVFGKGNHYLPVDVSGLTAGLYFLTLKTEKEKYTVKFIVEQ